MKIVLREKYFNIRIILFVFYNFVYVLYTLGYMSRSINLASLGLFSLACLIGCLKNERITKFNTETYRVLFSLAVIFVISICIQFINFDINLKLFSNFLYVVLPIIDAWLLINSSDDDELKLCLMIVFVRMVALFMLQNLGNFSLGAILSIKWGDSQSSVFESSMAHEFLFATIIFKFFNKNWLAIASALLCLLCFKRVSFIVAVFVILGFNLIKPNSKVNRAFLFVAKIGFMISPFVLLFLISDVGQDVFKRVVGIDLNTVATGRIYYITYVKNHIPYFNGYGSINDFMRRTLDNRYVTDLHCDLLRITWECSIIGTIIYVNNMFEVAKKKNVVFFMMLYCFVEMFVSHFMEGMALWLMFYIFIYLTNTNNYIDERRKIKWTIA